MKGLKMIIDYEEGLYFIINNDPDRIRQMTLNLLRNSFKFTDKGFIKI